MKQRLFILSQYLLPHHLLSRLIGCAAECRAEIAEGMSAREIAEAQRQARAWLNATQRRAA